MKVLLLRRESPRDSRMRKAWSTKKLPITQFLDSYLELAKLGLYSVEVLRDNLVCMFCVDTAAMARG